MKRRFRKKNPSGLDSNTVVLLGIGTALFGAVVYAIWSISDAKDTLAQTNDQISASTQAAQDIAAQGSEAAGQVAGQIGGATQTVQNVQQSPLVQGANSAVQTIQDAYGTVQGWLG